MKKKNKIHIVVDSLFSEKQIKETEDDLCYMLYNRFKFVADDARTSRDVIVKRGIIEIKNLLQAYSEKQTIMPGFKVLLNKKESIYYCYVIFIFKYKYCYL